MVTEIRDDGVAGQPRRLELGQAFAHLRVHLRQPVVVLGPVLPHLGGVRVIGGDPHPDRVVHRPVRPLADAALVRDPQVEHREERRRPRPPVPRSVAPVRLVRRLVPHPARLLDVVVLLRVVGRVVAGRAQELREHRHPVGQPHPAAHVVRPDGRRVHPGDDRGPRGRAHRRVRPRVQVDRAALGQSIQVRRVGVRVTVGPEGGSVVLAAQPQDVRPLLGVRRPGPGDDRSSQHQRRHDCPCAHDRLQSAGNATRATWPAAGIRCHSPAFYCGRDARTSGWRTQGPGPMGGHSRIAASAHGEYPLAAGHPCDHARRASLASTRQGAAGRKPSWALSKPPPIRGDARC